MGALWPGLSRAGVKLTESRSQCNRDQHTDSSVSAGSLDRLQTGNRPAHVARPSPEEIGHRALEQNRLYAVEAPLARGAKGTTWQESKVEAPAQIARSLDSLSRRLLDGVPLERRQADPILPGNLPHGTHCSVR
jgi:hypothetical protein